MKSYTRSHLANPALLRSASEHRAHERTGTAELLADIAEIDARNAHVPAGYASISLYCAQELQLSPDAAYKRIQAARTAREFPVLFGAVEDGRLHLSAVCLLAPHLTAENVNDLVAAATHRSKSEIELVLARRFPKSEMMPMVEAVPGAWDQLAPGQVGEPNAPSDVQLAPGQVDPPAKVAPIAPERFALHVSIGQSTRDKLQYAQELLSHQVASGDLAAVLERALDALIHQLEKAKFAATDRPRAGRRASANRRHVPDPVKRAVWARDGGQCTFVSETGHRCTARTRIEFDHIVPVARGGVASVGGTRLLCRAHNQFEAERMLGGDFMRQKREAARAKRTVTPAGAAGLEAAAAGGRETAAAGRAAAAGGRETAAAGRAAAATCPGASSATSVRPEASSDVLRCLRNLGFRADEARAAAALSDSIPGATLQEQVRVALSYFHKGRSALVAAASA